MLGYGVALFFITANLICVLIISISYHVDPNMFVDGGQSNSKLYYKPWSRCGAYFVGVVFGFMFWEYKKKESFTWSLGHSFFQKLHDSRLV